MVLLFAQDLVQRRVIIDCDPGVDDIMALLLAFSSPELKVEGITIVMGNNNGMYFVNWR